MIDLSQYRLRVGCYNNSRNRRSKQVSITGNFVPDIGVLDALRLFVLIYLYLYFALCVMSTSIGMALECHFRPFVLSAFHGISDNEFNHLFHSHSKSYAAVLIFFLFKKDWWLYKILGFSPGLLGKLNFSGLENKPVSYGYIQLIMHYLNIAIVGCMLWIHTLNAVLVIIFNPSLLNPGPTTYLKVVSFNAHGLIPFSQLQSDNPSFDNTKIFELHHYIHCHKPDILMINETWLKKSIIDSEVIPESYKVFRLDRSSLTHPPDPLNPRKFRKHGGGVLVAIRRDIDIVSTKLEYKCPAELLGITLKFRDGSKLILCSFYRVGNLGANNHNAFQEYVRKARQRRGVKGIVVAGDLNLPGIDWRNYCGSNPVEQLFLDTFSNFGIEQLITSPTHSGGNVLDLVLTDKPHLVSNIQISEHNNPCKSDHFAVSFTLKSKVKRIKSQKRESLNFKRANWDALNADFVDIDWQAELSGDMETSWNKFKEILEHGTNEHIPKIKIGGRAQPPWFDAESHQACLEKERLHESYKKTTDPSCKAEKYFKFSKSRSDFKKLASKKMASSFEDEDDSNLITKKFWSYVKATSKNTRIPEQIHLDDVHKSDHTDQANLFNNFFHQQFSSPSNYDVHFDTITTQDDIDYVSTLFSSSRIVNILGNLNTRKAMGPDKIHGEVLKKCAHTLAPALEILFTKCYVSGNLPSNWKCMIVVPVHKKGSKNDVKNYRPISLTSLVVKVMERIIRDELLGRCNELIDPRQHGFLPNKSCTTQMVEFCDSLFLSLNRNIRSDVVYFDFAKAFDSVNHDLILYKLKYYYNIDGMLLQFMKSYLSGREQSVVVNGAISATLPVLSGVPQGSIIGPTLFVLFINDIYSGLSHGTNILLYADDTKIWREISEQEDHNILQHDINFLMTWARTNKMKFHPDKCKVLAILKRWSPFDGILPFTRYIYSMGQTLLEYTDSEKDLGIIMTSSLNFNSQADALYGKANQKFGMLKRNCHFVNDLNKRRVLYLTLVRSIFEHCPIIWRPTSDSTIAKLEGLQKRALKWIRNDYSVSYSVEEIYHAHCKRLNILPLKYRFDYHDLKFFHSLVHQYHPCTTLPQYLTFFSGSSRLRSSHLDHLSVISSIPPGPSVSKSYFYRAHLSWNRLPLSLRETIRPGVFKNELIKHIWKEFVCTSIDNGLDSDLDNSFSSH